MVGIYVLLIIIICLLVPLVAYFVLGTIAAIILYGVLMYLIDAWIKSRDKGGI